MKRRTELLVLGVLQAGSAALMAINAASRFVGPDHETYRAQGLAATQLSFWTDPGSLNANYWPLGYPTFRATVDVALGTGDRPVQALQAILALTLAPLIWLLFRQLGRPTRMVAFGLVALSPTVLWMANNAGYEVLLAFLLTAATALVWGLGGKPNLHGAWAFAALAAAGLLSGAMYLVQNKTVVVIPVLAVLAWHWGRPRLIVYLLAAIAFPLVWGLRNLVVIGSLSLGTKNGTMNMWIGNNPEQVTGGYMEPPMLLVEPIRPLDIYGSNALHWVISQPEAAMTLLMRRAARLLEPLYPQFDSFPGSLSVIVKFGAIGMTCATILLFLAFAFGRLWVRPPAIPAVAPIAILVVVFYLVHLPFLAEPRFLAPVTPMAIAVAVATAFAAAARVRKGQARNQSDSARPLAD